MPCYELLVKMGFIGRLQIIQQVRTKNIDGEVLANMALICHECALKNSELYGLKIGDVSKAGVAYNHINVKGESLPISISGTAQGIIQNHINHLKKCGHSLRLDSPLFPQKKSKAQYTSKLFNEHVDECLKNKDSDFRLENIRQAGIRNHFEELLKKRIPADKCLEQTADFARCNIKNPSEERHLKNLLAGQIQRSGNKPLQQSDWTIYYSKIENAHSYRRENINSILEKIEKIKFIITTKQRNNKFEELSIVFQGLSKIEYEIRREPKLDDQAKLKSILEQLENIKQDIHVSSKSNCEAKAESNLLVLEEVANQIASEPKLSAKEVYDLKIEHLERLRNQIKSEPKLTDEVKGLMSNRIDEEIKSIESSFLTVQTHPSNVPRLSLAELIESYKAVDKPCPRLMKLMKCFGYVADKSEWKIKTIVMRI